MQEKDAQIRALSADNAEQLEQLEALEERVSRLEQGGSGVVPSANSALLLGIILVVGIVLGRGKWIFLR